MFETSAGLTLLSETDMVAVNGGCGCDDRRRRHHHHHHDRCGRRDDNGGQGQNNSITQNGLIDVVITGNDDTVIINL